LTIGEETVLRDPEDLYELSAEFADPATDSQAVAEKKHNNTQKLKQIQKK